jgi:hypothetical protein
MEFDLNSFMFEVTNALQHVTPQSRTPDARENLSPGDGQLPQHHVLEGRGQEYEAPLSKRRRLSPGHQVTSRGCSGGTRSPVWDDFINLDSGSETSDHIPAYFHPSKNQLSSHF